MPSASASTKPAEQPVANPPMELQPMVTEEGRFVDIPIDLLRQPPPKPAEFLYFQQYHDSAPLLRQALKKCTTTEDAIDLLATELETMHALITGYVKSLCTVTTQFDEDIAKVNEQHASLQDNFFFCKNLLLHTHQVLSNLQGAYSLLKNKVELKVSEHAGLQKLPEIKASNGRKHLVSDPEMTARQKARNQDHQYRIFKTKTDAAAVQEMESYGHEKAMVDELAHPQLHPPKSSGKGKGKGRAGPLFEPHVRVKVEKLVEGLDTMRETFTRVHAKTDREFENIRFQIAGATKDASEFWRLHDDMSNKASLEQGEWIKHLKRTHAAYTAWAERPAPEIPVTTTHTTDTPKLAESRPSSAAYPTPSLSQTPDSDAGPSQDAAAPPPPHVDLPFDPRASAYAIHISVDHNKPVDELTRDEAIAMLKALPQRFEVVPQAAIVAFENEQKLAYITWREGQVRNTLETLAKNLEAETGIQTHPDAPLPPIVPKKRTEVYGEPFPVDAQGTGPARTSTPAAKSSSIRSRASTAHPAILPSTSVPDGKGKSRKREREPAANQLTEKGVEAEDLPGPKMRSQKNKRVRRA